MPTPLRSTLALAAGLFALVAWSSSCDTPPPGIPAKDPAKDAQVHAAQLRYDAALALTRAPSPEHRIALAAAYFPDVPAVRELFGSASDGAASDRDTRNNAARASETRTVNDGHDAMEETASRASSGLRIFTPSDARAPWRLAESGRAFSIRPIREHAAPAPSPLIRVGGALYDGDAFFVAAPDRLEELTVIDALDPGRTVTQQRFVYEITLPADVHRIRDTGESLELLDDSGAPRLRFTPAIVRDLAGNERIGTREVSGAELVDAHLYAATGATVRVATTVSLDGLAPPLVVDPSWSTTTALATARQNHTATLLPDGRVLVAGGLNGSTVLSSVEIFDPVSRTWTAGPAMNAGHTGHTALLLRNGTVLVAGGGNPSSPAIATAELYDPATNSWSVTGSMATARWAHTATLLPNGKVLVAGGDVSFVTETASCELYDPATGAWSPAASMSSQRAEHTATLLTNGKVVVAGGALAGSAIKATEQYDPATNTWALGANLPVARMEHSATLLPQGGVLVVGGKNTGGFLGSADLYAPATGAWTATQARPTGSSAFHSATVLPNGTVVAASGVASGSYSAGVAAFDGNFNTWTAFPNITTARYAHTATLLTNGSVLVVGGANNFGPLTSVELLNPGVDQWAFNPSMSTPRANHTLTTLADGRVLATGGVNASGVAQSSAAIYDGATNTWTAAPSMSTARYFHAAALLPNGKVLVMGGYNGTATVGSAEIFDPATNTWAAAPAMASPRQYHTATRLLDGRIFVVSGMNGTAYVSSTEIYDPTSNTWSAGPNVGGRRYHSTIRMLDGRVLIFGGDCGSFCYAGAQIYNPATNTSIAGPSTAVSEVRGQTAELLPDGRVLFAGGYDGANGTAGAQVYNPSNNTFTALPNMTSVRNQPSPGMTTDGRALVFGGVGPGPAFPYLTSADIYDPATNSWSVGNTGSMSCYDSRTAPLAGGRILEAGGWCGSNSSTASSAGASTWDPAPAYVTMIPSVTAPSSVASGATITIAGSGFTGMGSNGSGNTQNSEANVPTVTLKGIVDDRFLKLTVQSFTPTQIVAFVPSGVVAGEPYFLNVTVAGAIGSRVVSGTIATAPVANNQSVTTLANNPLTITLTATDPNGDPLTYSIVTQPAHGTLSGGPNPVTYTPANNYVGPDNFTFVANDGTQNSNTATVNIQVNPPAPTITTPAASASIPSRTFTFSGAALPNATVTVTEGATTVATIAANGSGAYSQSITLPYGAHTLSAKQTVSSNQSAAATRSFTLVDATAPTFTSTPPNLTGEATSASGRSVTYTMPSATDDSGVAPTVSCSPGSGTFPIGTTTVTCTATDNAGNSATTSFTVTVLDTTPPTMSAAPPNQTKEATSSAGASATFTPPTATDTVDGNVTVTCAPASGATFPLGVTTVTCTATDAHGNSATRTFTITVQDTTPPTISNVPANLTVEATSSAGATVTYSAPTATDTVSGSLPVTCTPASGATFALGTTPVSCSATDGKGNTATASFTVTVHDTTAPVFSATPNLTAEATSSSGAAVTFNVTATDSVSGNVMVSCTPASGSTFALGNTQVTCTAADAAGNPASASFVVNVADTKGPVFSGVPANQTVEATSPSGAVVTWTDPTAVDAVTGPATVTCAPASGSTFPLGVTNVVCTATDGNGTVATAQFVVIVQDTNAPTITGTPADMTVEATSSSGATVTWAAPTAMDATSNAVPVSCTPASGSPFALGATTVICTATDSAGNSASTAFKVTVVDTTPPALSNVPGDLQLSVPSSSDSTIATWTDPTALDLVSGALPVSCAPASGAMFQVGSTKVTCSATDSAGNVGSATFNVIVTATGSTDGGSTDGGMSSGDGGETTDGGSLADGGGSSTDGGEPSTDAGTGPSEDGGSGNPPAVVGGCGCATGTSGGSGTELAGLFAFGLLALVRVRGSSRR